MDATQFRTEFAHIAAAPGGVQCLRELVIYLAIHGRLGPRGARDPERPGTNLELADQIEQTAFDRKQLRRQPALPPVPEVEARAFPAHWTVTRLGKVIRLVSGQHLSADEQNSRGQGIPYLTGAADFGSEHPVVSRWTSTARAIAIKGDILIAVKGTVGKTNVLNFERAALGRQLMAARPLALDGGFLHLILRAHEQHFIGKSVGIAIPGISREDVLHLVIGVPPPGEQTLIIDKVRELLSLCGKFEVRLRQREKLCTAARDATFGSLGASRTGSSLEIAWKRVASHAPILLNSPLSVQSYRGAILDLAMSGALLPRSERNRYSGAQLLLEIERRRQSWCQSATGQELKEALAVQKKVRRQGPAQVDLPIPAHWVWASILQVSQAVVDCHNKTAPYVPRGIHLVRTADIRNRRMDLSRTRKVAADTYTFWSRRLPPKANDIVFTREAPMGEAAIVPDGERVCLGQRTMLIRLFPDLFNSRFLIYAIYSPSFQSRMFAAAIGMTVKHLRVGDVEELLVPVPPKEEQDRIVAFLDRMIGECDRLEDTLGRGLRAASSLARAVTETITGIRIGDRNVMTKIPKTELVSALRIGSPPRISDSAPLAAILVKSNGELPAKVLWNSSGLEIDVFYQQLRTEMARGWIVQPEPAYVKEVEEADAPVTP